MPHLAENAIKLAILNHPETFGLTSVEVNPMLMFTQQRIEEGSELGEVELWQQCFESVNTTLHLKVVEVFTGLSVLQSKAQETAIATQGEVPKNEPKSTPEPPKKSGNSKPSGNGGSSGAPGKELSTRQLRYLGYLTRQAGEEPDYTDISKLSQKEATLRIKELEAKVKGEAAAG